MTESLRARLQTIIISSADDLATFWRELMGGGGFGQRTLWLIAIDELGHPETMIASIDDLPLAPTQPELRNLEVTLAEMAAYGTVVILISRPGVPAVQESDRRWARALTPMAPTWPVHLATADVQGRCEVRSIL